MGHLRFDAVVAVAHAKKMSALFALLFVEAAVVVVAAFAAVEVVVVVVERFFA